MRRPTDDTMSETRQFFLERARMEQPAAEQQLSERLAEMAEAIQEHARMLEALRYELTELRHVVGSR